MQVALKFVSFVCMHRRQHNCSSFPISAVQNSCPENTHFFIPLLLPFGDQISVRITVLEKPLVELLRYGFFVVVEVIYIS